MASTNGTLSRAVKRQFKVNDLCSALNKASLVFQPYRQRRKDAIRLAASGEYGENASPLRRPWNGIGLFRRVILQSLIGGNPRALLSTWQKEHKIAVSSAQDWSNRQFERISLGDNLRRWADDALFWMGVMMTGITTPIESERTGWRTFAGEAYAQTVDPDDYLCDTFARNFDELSWEGNRYRANAKVANILFKLRGEKRLEGEATETTNQDGDERVAMIGRGYTGGDYDEFGEMVDLWQFYLPAYRMMLTFRGSGGKLPAGETDLLFSQEYVGPERGPYLKLGFDWVPGNLLPRGPIMDLMPLDESINNQLRKLLRQAERFKQNNVYTGKSEKDMARLNAADDGDDVRVENIGEIKQWVSMPPNPQLFGFTQAMMQIFNKLGGNLDTLGGLARQAGTAKQEEQLNANASGYLGGLQRSFNSGTSQVMNNLLWYYWLDPEGVMRSEFKLRSVPEVGTIRNIYPRRKEGEEADPDKFYRDMAWDDLDVKVDPYSLGMDTPQTKLAHLQEVMTQSLNWMPYLEKQGLLPDGRFYFTKQAEYRNNPDISELLHLQELPEQEESARNDAPTKPPVSERTYTRRGESEATDEGQTKDMMQQLMGAGMNGAGDFEIGGME